jgi:threonine dehydratase
LQRVGAFKFRGAWNAMSQLTESARQKGVVTHSSGNHAQAIALCGKLLDIPTTIVMPNNAPRLKRNATAAHGATIIDYDPAHKRREEISANLAKTHGYTLVPPFDHPHVIAGQGTAALEMLEDQDDLDLLLVPCGGGGLLSGSALSARHLAPQCRVIGVEPMMADDAARSFRSGKIERVSNPNTIADGTRTESLGKITFALIRQNVDDIVTVPEDAIKEAVRLLFRLGKLVVEPSGALGLAALLSSAVPTHGRIGIMISGGNIDDQCMTELLRTM